MTIGSGHWLVATVIAVSIHLAGLWWLIMTSSEREPIAETPGEGIVVTLGRSDPTGLESMDAPEVEAAREEVAEARSQTPEAVDDAAQPLLADTAPGEPDPPEPDTAPVESTPPAEIQPAPETPAMAAPELEVAAPQPAAEVPEEAPTATVPTPAEAVTETQTTQPPAPDDTSTAEAVSVAPDAIDGTLPEAAEPLTVEVSPDRSGEAPVAPEAQPGGTALEPAPAAAVDALPESPTRSAPQPDAVAESSSPASTDVAPVEDALPAPQGGPDRELEAVPPAAGSGVEAAAAPGQPEAEIQPATAPRTVEAAAPETVKLQDLQRRSGGAGVVAHYAGVLKGWLQRNMHYPRAARLAGQEGDVVVRFVIDREGNVQSVELETGSGYPLLDREATEMVERGDPFPAMPEDMPGDRLEVRVPVSFHVRDETLEKDLPPIDLE
ncbi:MAG TPA: TonB family protein [Arenicellales bacterium]|nr:TonB family protein [Arenicellales bacterium]